MAEKRRAQTPKDPVEPAPNTRHVIAPVLQDRQVRVVGNVDVEHPPFDEDVQNLVVYIHEQWLA